MKKEIKKNELKCIGNEEKRNEIQGKKIVKLCQVFLTDGVSNEIKKKTRRIFPIFTLHYSYYIIPRLARN
jgi:ribosomal protein S3AE